MKKKRTRWLWLLVVVLMAIMGANGVHYGPALAGDLQPSAAPGPTMKTLDEIPPT